MEPHGPRLLAADACEMTPLVGVAVRVAVARIAAAVKLHEKRAPAH